MVKAYARPYRRRLPGEPERTRINVEMAIAQGVPTSKIMETFRVSYSYVYTLRKGMGEKYL